MLLGLLSHLASSTLVANGNDVGSCSPSSVPTGIAPISLLLPPLNPMVVGRSVRRSLLGALAIPFLLPLFFGDLISGSAESHKGGKLELSATFDFSLSSFTFVGKTERKTFSIYAILSELRKYGGFV